MSAYEEHAFGLGEIEAELGDDCPQFSYNSSPFRCLPGGAKFKRKNDTGGFTLESDLQLTCLVDQFNGSVPDSGETLSYLGRDYTIVSVTPAPGGYQMRINADLNVQGL